MALQFADHPQHVAHLVAAALQASDPARAVRQHLRRDGRLLRSGSYQFELDKGRVYVVAMGKAALPMGMAVAEILDGDLAGGILVTKKQAGRTGEASGLIRPEGLPATARLMAGGHPVSDEDSLRAAAHVAKMVNEAGENDLVICLVSGGASAIHAYPRIPLHEWQQLSRLLLASGCTIQEFNLVRRQLDRVKGGRLARFAAPAACISLILSDVVGNDVASIGSGPTVPGDDDPDEALAILARYGIPAELEAEAWQRIRLALARAAREVKPEPAFLANTIVADVATAAGAAMVRAAQLGFLANVLTTHLQGEARQVGNVVAAIARDMQPQNCLILGGETTVTVTGPGRGGRNQEVALAAGIALEGTANVVVASFATDGEDGTSEAAGAIVDGQTVARARALGLDAGHYLEQNDSHTFFHRLSGPGPETEASFPPPLIETGPTGTNVNDLICILSYPGGAAHDNT